MEHHLSPAAAAAAFVGLTLIPGAAPASEPTVHCPADTRRPAIDKQMRARAVVSMILPTVYASLSTDARATSDRERLRPSGPVSSRRPSGFAGDHSSQIGWEIGLAWDPVRILERSRRIARARRRALRRRLAPGPVPCLDGSTESRTSSSDEAFEQYLQGVISQHRREALGQLLD